MDKEVLDILATKRRLTELGIGYQKPVAWTEDEVEKLLSALGKLWCEVISGRKEAQDTIEKDRKTLDTFVKGMRMAAGAVGENDAIDYSSKGIMDIVEPLRDEIRSSLVAPEPRKKKSGRPRRIDAGAIEDFARVLYATGRYKRRKEAARKIYSLLKDNRLLQDPKCPEEKQVSTIEQYLLKWERENKQSTKIN